MTDTMRVPSTPQTLRRLFLTLFLRGRSSRGATVQKAPVSIGKRLGQALAIYALLGMMVFSFSGQTVFIIAAYLHATTFIFLGMFVSSSAGEILFNRDESDILMHRPIEPRALLWSKIAMLVQVSIWMAAAFNLAGFIVGALARDGGWPFVLVHALSTSLEALFCTATVVLTYQLCLRWFGRERLDALMTTTQVIVSIAFVLSAQLVPQFMMRLDGLNIVRIDRWWIGFLPPAWFAGIDDALVGSASRFSWMLGALGIVATALVLWIAFQKLATSYEAGLQSMTESPVTRKTRTRPRVLERMVHYPPLSWWLRDSVSRSSFLLSAAYLLRDRDTKMRVYPGIAPMLAMPIIMLMPRSGHTPGRGNAFGAAFAGSYVGLVPLVVLGMLELSQQWQAADVFRLAPVTGPSELANGARRAVLLLITLPMIIVFMLIVMAIGKTSQLNLMIPGMLALPVYAMIPCLDGRAVPLSRPVEEAKAATRGFKTIGVMIVSAVIAGAAMFADRKGMLMYLCAVEAPIVAVIYVLMRRSAARAPWPSID